VIFFWRIFSSTSRHHVNVSSAVSPSARDPRIMPSSRVGLRARLRCSPLNASRRALLEDRFGLKVHSEIRELPVYAITAARGGARLTPSKPGSCVVIDMKSVLKGSAGSNYCGRFEMTRGTVRVADAKGMTVAEFAARVFRDTLDRPVIDRTSITGLFDIHLEFSGLENSAAPGGAADNTAPSVFTAVQEQLGLKLSPDRGPVEVLVIEHVKKPSAN
jgi:uncharacterized protein (TIGR03435 family)